MTDRSDWQRHVGIGEPSRAFVRHGDTRTRKVIAEEGPHRGKPAGTQTEHKDGRVDSTVYAQPVTASIPPPNRRHHR